MVALLQIWRTCKGAYGLSVHCSGFGRSLLLDSSRERSAVTITMREDAERDDSTVD